MGKFIKSKFKTTCAQTGKKIEIGSDVFYIPGRGTYSFESALYQNTLKEYQAENRKRYGKE